jgi:hypothetical protein
MNDLLDCIQASTHPCATSIRITCPRHLAANSTTDFKMGARFIARSILEWTKESGIIIASHVFKDHQIVRDLIDNAKTIKKYAQHVQLGPHDEIFGGDQVLHDVKVYATDGFCTVNTTGAKDIITSEQTLRHAGKGARSNILMPRNPID